MTCHRDQHIGSGVICHRDQHIGDDDDDDDDDDYNVYDNNEGRQG